MSETRTRLRELGFTLGSLPTGHWNAITDVPGVGVGHATVITDQPATLRTGVTVIMPRPAVELSDLAYGGLSSFNGNGELTGSHWLSESGLVAGPIAITNTDQVGLVRDELVAYEVARTPEIDWCLPLVGETWDGTLNDIHARGLRAEHVHQALDAAAASSGRGPVAEGNVGGGTGMICHGFKGGIGTSSRLVATADEQYTVGVLVQANYGHRELLSLGGRAVGRAIDHTVVPLPPDDTPAASGDTGSIIVVVATDAPLVADQCTRLARRATVGLSRVGGFGSDSSGDIFLAFATGNRVPATATGPLDVRTLPHEAMTPLFRGVAEATEEAIWNALCAAQTMTGFRGATVHAIPLDRLAALR
ncbi:MAG: P1 family peptidase [Kineosporiaceae bacterium]|nr:P1 family peptidase [Kineosporiaceae bacterium]MBK7622840.1 P1 family peptidase [Kineosporiaceae bacterium]MBK8078111.1 P1 family peptidase [Kineosporiaceae bacterium]